MDTLTMTEYERIFNQITQWQIVMCLTGIFLHTHRVALGVNLEYGQECKLNQVEGKKKEIFIVVCLLIHVADLIIQKITEGANIWKITEPHDAKKMRLKEPEVYRQAWLFFSILAIIRFTI